MPDPITSLLGTAERGWHALSGDFVNTWHDLYDVLTFYDFKPRVLTALAQLAQLIEYDSDMAAVNLSTVANYGADTAAEHRRALLLIRGTLLGRYADNARNEAVNWARAADLRLDQVLTRRIAAEHAAMLTRVLTEEMARQVAVAAEHADMVTRVAQEANTRHLADLQLDSVLTARIAQAKQQVLAVLAADVQQIDQLIAQVRAFAQSIPGLIDQRAVNGYDPTLRARSGGLQRLIDTAAAHDPLISDLVKKLAGFLLDLAGVDDPLIRLAAQLVLRQLIDRLGLDTALGAIVNDLIGGILSGGQPKTLLDVTRDIGNRLNAAEGSLAALSPLAGEADDLHEMGSLAFDAALLAYLAAAVADPRAAADDTAAALDPVVTPLLAPVRALLGM